MYLLDTNVVSEQVAANDKIDGFSADCLMTFLTALDQDVQIVIRTKPRERAAARMSVVAA